MVNYPKYEVQGVVEYTFRLFKVEFLGIQFGEKGYTLLFKSDFQGLEAIFAMMNAIINTIIIVKALIEQTRLDITRIKAET